MTDRFPFRTVEHLIAARNDIKTNEDQPSDLQLIEAVIKRLCTRYNLILNEGEPKTQHSSDYYD